MKIKRVQIKNGYKRFQHLKIELGDRPARIVAFLGPNGCGKSNVLDALLFKQTNQYQQIGNGSRDHTYHSMRGLPI